MPGLQNPPTSLADGGCGERKAEGQREGRTEGTAVPQPVLAGTDTHQGRSGPLTLQHFSLWMLLCKRHWNLQEVPGSAHSHKTLSFCRDHSLQPIAKGVHCFFEGLGGFLNYFYLLF